MKLITIILFTSSVFINLYQCQEETLELLHVVFRHGSRTPDSSETYLNDPYKEKAFYPYGYGELTNDGKRRSYKLGNLLNAKYKTFLGENYENGLVETYTTDLSRTKSSALLVMAGLFPPSSSQIWHKDILWNPIPYSYVSFAKDYWIRHANNFCPKYNEIRNKNFKDNQNILDAHGDDLEYISNHTGQTIRTYEEIFKLYQTLTAEENLNLTLPKWTGNIHPSVTYPLASKMLTLSFSNSELKRLSGGRMMEKILEHIEKKSKNSLVPSNRKIYLYSGHDLNVIGILSVINAFDEHFPKYSSAVIIELHKNADKGHYVKFFYVRDVDKPIEEVSVKGCDLLCSLDSFKKLVEPYIPVNYTKECEATVNLDEHNIR